MKYKTQQQKSWQKHKSACEWSDKMENVSSKDLSIDASDKNNLSLQIHDLILIILLSDYML
jgi:hypothetical protein